MTTLEFIVGKKDFHTTQEILSRIHFEDIIMISLNRHVAVYRILIEDEHIADVIQELKESIKSFRLRAVSKIDGDFLAHMEEPSPSETYAFRALNISVKDGMLIMRRFFGFKN